jgi:hypothetical protein
MATSCGFFDQLLQFPALIHLDDNIAAADQFAVNPQLWERRPVGVLRQLGADVRVLQDINVGKALAAGGQRLNRLCGKTAVWQLWRAFHVQQNRVLSNLVLNFFNRRRHLLLPQATSHGYNMHHTGYCSGWNSRKKTPSFARAFTRRRSRFTGNAIPVKTYAQNNIFNPTISLIYFGGPTARFIISTETR